METKTWRIEAPDGKTLFSFCAVFLSEEEKHRETFSKLLSFYKTQFEGAFREKLLKNYHENRDPGKRLHVQPLRCTLEGIHRNGEKETTLLFRLMVRRGGKTLFFKEDGLKYDEIEKLYGGTL